ncbi:MAG: hypothetical protein AAGF11_31235 [Myxococcota bacterium]
MAADPSWLSQIPWTTVAIVAIVLVLVVAAIVLVVRWRRKRAASATTSTSGPSVSTRLSSIWRPFYQRIPRRARHYPTFVVMGEAGAGKSHLIDSRVDWRGQANQFNHSAYHGAVLQLYLGPEVIVHELSAPLLRNVSGSAKRALTRMWRHMGPSATVVVVLDARTLATTPPADLRALAQLVRGKIGLFPGRVHETLEIRVTLTHLDQVEGYEEFASVVGTHIAGLDVDRLGPDYADADALVAAYDAHLAYALTTRDGGDFSRLVSFYDGLAGLLGTLTPLLLALRGEDRFATQYTPGDLYLGSIVPHSYVGDPFTANPELVVASIERYNQRSIRGALVAGLATLAVILGLTVWHYMRIVASEEAVEQFRRSEDGKRAASIHEQHMAEDAAEALDRMSDSEVLWLRWFAVERKERVEREYERTIRTFHLEPWLEVNNRITLLYVVSLIYATNRPDDELGLLILENSQMWAEQLELSDEIVEGYVRASHDRTTVDVTLPDEIGTTGQEWTQYLRRLHDAFERETIAEDALAQLRQTPVVLSAKEYEVLEEVRQLLIVHETLGAQLRPLLADGVDSQWAVNNEARLRSLAATLAVLLDVEDAHTRKARTEYWGLGQLKDELEYIEQLRQEQQPGTTYEFDTIEHGFDTGQAATVMARTRARFFIRDTLGAISQRIAMGRAFFEARKNFPDAGVVQGYGGRASEPLSGFYTKLVFDGHVEPVLSYAANELPQRELTRDDRSRLESVIREAAEAYASAYRNALITYYQGFEFRPGSAVALPYALKPLTQPSSWFTDFLTTVSKNATMTLPNDEYHAPMARALEVFEPLNALLAEDKGAIPGLEPYAAIVAGLIPLLEEGGDTGAEATPEDGLRPRLSALGLLTLDTLTGTEVDRREQVSQWLEGAGVDYSWHEPFDRPVGLIYRYGSQNVEDEVEQAWEDEVRPVARPLLAQYPFDGSATEDAAIADIEAVMRQQGKEPGQFWERFDQLIAPATTQNGERYVMLGEVYAPLGMLELVHDVQDLSTALWDDDGARIPLMLEITPQTLPRKAYDGRVASMAYLRSGGSAVYGFNQRPEPQTLALRWWEQGTSIVSLKMTVVGATDSSREYTLEEGGTTFSFYHLLDRARRCEGTRCSKETTGGLSLTRWAVARGQGCRRWAGRGTTELPVSWRVPLDAKGTVAREVRFVLDSDPWAPFVVRDCR